MIDKYSIAAGSALLILSLLFIGSNQMQAQDLIAEGAKPEMITEGHQFTEGPYWNPAGFLLYSDIPANQVYRWAPGEGKSVYLEPSGHSNGITADTEGRIILCQHDGRVSRMDNNKNLTVLASQYNGKRLNSPNDVVVRSDGLIYFTDPPFGVSEEARELTFSGVYLLGKEGSLTLLYDKFTHPNGIVLSPDEQTLYVNDSRTGSIVKFTVNKDGSLSSPQDFATVGAMADNGAADGMVVDMQGRLYSTGPGGVSVFDPSGKKVGLIEFPDRITNLDWGGKDVSTLFATAPAGIYRLQMNVKGFKK